MPQVIIGNERTLSVRDQRALSAGLAGSPLQLWRKKSAWCNADALAEWISLLGKTLAPFLGSRYFILSLDACPTHLTEKVARACARAHIRLHWLPGGMTGMMHDLKNAARKRRRLKEKARNLSDADLVELMALRQKGGKGAAVRGTSGPAASAAGSVASPKGTSGSASVTESVPSERSPAE